MAEDIFKNVQVLRGVPADQFLGTMGFISAALSMNCSECHHTGSVQQYADDTPMKQTARRMIIMINAFNKANFGGKRMVTCYTCHRGSSDVPKVTPSLAEQYGTPPPDDPDEVVIPETPAPAPSADAILNKYIQALGGAQRLATFTSFSAKGMYEGYETEGEKVAVEVFAKAPNQRTTIVHLRSGNMIKTYDGSSAWQTSAGSLLPIPILNLTGSLVEAAKLDADMSFPGQIKQVVKQPHTGFPSTTIDDIDVDIVQGSSPDNTPIKLYFDKKSGLLLRLVRYDETVIGLNPEQIDYSDYRDVAGVKFPFHWVTTWTDGRSTFEMSEVQGNVPIDATRFAKPAAPASPQPAAP